MQKKRILIVEDEILIAESIKYTLENLGYIVPKIAGSSSQALSILKNNIIHLVLMDINLKGRTDGIEIAKKINQQFSIPLIYITALSDKKTLEKAKMTNPYGYINKPFQTKDLQSTLEMALYRHEMEMKIKKKEDEYKNKLKTKIEQKTKELNDIRQDLIEKERLAVIGRIAATVSHELRNPLGAVRNAAYYLKNQIPKSEKKIHEYLALIEEEVKSSNTIINELLDTVRTAQPKKIIFSLSELIDNILKKSPLPQKVKYTINLSEIPFNLNADPDLLSRVFQNLFLNALYELKGNGQITITAEKNHKKSVITFFNSGKKIPRSMQEKIFQPLFTTKAKGTGMGLWICKDIIERHKGNICIDKTINKGTIFIIKIPY